MTAFGRFFFYNVSERFRVYSGIRQHVLDNITLTRDKFLQFSGTKSCRYLVYFRQFSRRGALEGLPGGIGCGSRSGHVSGGIWGFFTEFHIPVPPCKVSVQI